MLSEEPGENLPRERPFRITSYSDGYYDFKNGQFSSEPMFSPAVIQQWDRDNERLYAGAAWGAGQALFFKDQPLTFGRQSDKVDVVISNDITAEGQPLADSTISREHFELEPPKDGKIVIKDLGARNGENIYRDGKHLGVVKDKARTHLEAGDWIIVGDARLAEGAQVKPGEGGTVGFRVFEDVDNKLFLVKFNQEELAEMFIQGQTLLPVGKTHLPREVREWPLLYRSIEAAYHGLNRGLVELENVTVAGKSTKEAFKKAEVFYADLFADVENIAEKLLSGDVARAADLIGKLALDQSEQSKRQNNTVKAQREAKLAALLKKIANGIYIE